MGILRFREGKKANREEITKETWILVFIPILKEPTLGTQQKGIPEATLRPKIPAAPAISPGAKAGRGWGGVRKIGGNTEGVWAPGSPTQRERTGQTGRRTTLRQPGYLTPERRLTYRRDLPTTSFALAGASRARPQTSGGHVTSTCEAIVGPLDFRRKCLRKAAGAELSVAFCSLSGVSSFPIGHFQTDDWRSSFGEPLSKILQKTVPGLVRVRTPVL